MIDRHFFFDNNDISSVEWVEMFQFNAAEILTVGAFSVYPFVSPD